MHWKQFWKDSRLKIGFPNERVSVTRSEPKSHALNNHIRRITVAEVPPGIMHADWMFYRSFGCIYANYKRGKVKAKNSRERLRYSSHL